MRNQMPPAGGILALESTRSYGSCSLSLVFSPIFGHSLLLLVVVRRPGTKYVAIVPRRPLNSATRKSHSSMKRTRVVHVAPWMAAVIHRVFASTLDGVHDPWTSVLTTPRSCIRPVSEDSLNQEERHSRWMELLIATWRFTTLTVYDPR